MRPLLTLALATLLAGCQTLEPSPAAVSACPDDHQPDLASSWLLKREQLCLLEGEEQRSRLREVENSSEQKRIEKILLASCEPEKTPGLLREALNELQGHSDPAMQALVNMIHDHAHSYRVLEERNAQLAAQLETTIDGLRQIEADMELQRRNRRTP